MHLVCYWQGNIEQSLQLQENLGVFRVVQRGGVSPEGFELPVTSSPKPCRVGRAHTRVPWKDTAMMTSHPHLKTLSRARGGSPWARCPHYRFVLVHSGQRGLRSQTNFQMLWLSHFWEPPPWTPFHKKPHHNLRDSFLHSLSNPSPWTKSAFLGCLSCVALCCLLSKLIILSLLFAFDIFLQPSQKKLTCYCTLIIYTFFHVYFLLATYGDIVLVFIVIVRPSVVSLYKCLQWNLKHHHLVTLHLVTP